MNYKCVESSLFSFLDRDRLYGLRLGMVRFNLHYTLTDQEFDRLVRAIRFVSEHGYRFLSIYGVRLDEGSWHYLPNEARRLGVTPGAASPRPGDESIIAAAEDLAGQLPQEIRTATLDPAIREHVYFPVVHVMS
jgi:hypothetical protein